MSSTSSLASSTPSSSGFFDGVLITRAPPPGGHVAPPPVSLSYSSDYEECHVDSLASLSSLLDSDTSSTRDSVFAPAADAGLTTAALPPGFVDLKDVHAEKSGKETSKAKKKKKKKSKGDDPLAFLATITPEFFSSQWAVAAAEKTVLALRSFARRGGKRLDLSFVGLGLVPLELVTLVANIPSLQRLILHGNELRSIPAALQELSSLTYLDLSRNMLEELHPGIGRLKGLTHLDLRWNRLETLPPQIGRLTALDTLLLASNALVHLPTATSRLVNLRVLDVYHNHVARITCVAPLTRLEHLDVSRNDLVLPSKAVCGLTSLTHLALHSNGLRKLSKDMSRLEGLTTLTLYGNKLTHLPASLGSLTALTALNVRENRLVALPDSIGRCTALTELNARANALVALPDSITSCTRLQVLNVADNNIYALPPDLGACAGLEELNVAYNNLYDLPSSLQALPHLAHLDAACNPLRALPPNALAYVSFRDLAPLRLARTAALPLWLMGSKHAGLGSTLAAHAAATVAPLAAVVLIVVAGHALFSSSGPTSDDSVWMFSALLAAFVVGLGLAVTAHIVLGGSAAAGWVPPFRLRLSVANAGAAAGVVVGAAQMAALNMHPDLGWPESLSQVVRPILLRFDGLFDGAPYVSLGLALGWAVFYRGGLELGLFASRGRWAETIIAVFVFVDPLVFLPTVRNLLAVLACSYWTDRQPTLASEPELECWTGNHAGAAAAAALGLVLYYPAAVIGAGPWAARLSSVVDVRRSPTVNAVLRQLAFVAAVGTAFFEPGKHSAVYVVTIAATSSAAAGIVALYRPYGAFLWKANIVEFATYAVVFVAAMLTVWVKVDDISSPWTVFTVLVVAAAIIYAAAGGLIGILDAADVIEDSDAFSFGDDGGWEGAASSDSVGPHVLPPTAALITQLRAGYDGGYNDVYDPEYGGYEFEGARLVFKHEKRGSDDELHLARNPMYTSMAWAAKQ